MQVIHQIDCARASLPRKLRNDIGMDGSIKSSMCLLRGPGGLIPNRPEKFGKLEENLKNDDGAKTALQHLVVQNCVYTCGFDLLLYGF